MEVKINLNNPPAIKKVNVDLQWNLKVIAPKPGLLARLFRVHNRVNKRLKITVVDIKVPTDIVCDKTRLFSILYQEQEIPQANFPVDVTLTEMSMPFQLLFNQSEIKDCRKPQDQNPRSYDITFKVKVSDENGKHVDSVSDKITVIFDPLSIKPTFAIDLNDEEIQYASSLKNERIGTLASWINEDFRFTPNQLATVSIKLYQDHRELPGLITFADKQTSVDLCIKHGRSNVIKTPIFVDFTNISNPLANEEDYTIETSIVISNAYSPEVKETLLKQTHFKLLKDLQGTELKFYLQLPDSEAMLCDLGRNVPAVPLHFVPRSRLMGQAKLILANIATDNSNPRAGLYIKNLTLTETVLDNAAVLDENGLPLTRFVKIDGPGVEAMHSPGGLFIANGTNARTAITISFNPSAIVDVVRAPNYDFRIQSVITFDYWEDKDGLGNLSPENRKEAKVPVTWQLHLDPNPEWLCVDYGSSAIVCCYDQEILDLKRQKSSIFRNADNGQYRVDTIESSTKFLSSDIVLHAVRADGKSTLCTQHRYDPTNPMPYLGFSVCLSPTSSLVKTDVRTQLPCLKILVGNEFLPEKRDFMSFKYTRLDANGTLAAIEAKDAKRMGEDTCLLRISTIFKEAYAELFRYFILPETNGKSINKLVLTYPNTYTPVHLKVLENIARETFPSVRDGFLRFVSESDAVAAYYLQNWDSYNGVAEHQITDTETVLVYDMGAGTLDLTLFRKTLGKNGKIEVNILGKIGTGKAGNYLDYLISEIIAEKVPGAVKGQKAVSTDAAPDVQTLIERLYIKQAVKNSIKPELRAGRTLAYNGVEFDSDLILDDERFKEFLTQVTLEIVRKLVTSVGIKDLHINTVLMSGRSCRLSALQKSLRDALKDSRIVKFKSVGDQEKTVVAEGAMARAGIFSSPETPVVIRSKRLYASYGIIYKKVGGTWRYTELLNSSNLPFCSDNTVLDDFEGPSVTATGTAAAGTIKLIQTYLSPKETEAAYNKADLEFISEMEEYDMACFDGKDSLNVKIKLDYKNNISLYVNGLSSVGTSPQGVDLSSDVTKRSVWPVTI